VVCFCLTRSEVVALWCGREPSEYQPENVGNITNYKAQGLWFPQILERKDIDAITATTPDRTARSPVLLPLLWGRQRMYGEKPLYDVREGQRMLKTLNRYSRIEPDGHSGSCRLSPGSRNHSLRSHRQRCIPYGCGKQEPTWWTCNSIATFHIWDMWLGPCSYADYTPQRCHLLSLFFVILVVCLPILVSHSWCLMVVGSKGLKASVPEDECCIAVLTVVRCGLNLMILNFIGHISHLMGAAQT